ncbi:hypothetical protein ACFWWM_39925 [Streptomyces sp. NPDC058682]
MAAAPACVRVRVRARYTGIEDEYGPSVTAPEKLALQDLLATCPQ